MQSQIFAACVGAAFVERHSDDIPIHHPRAGRLQRYERLALCASQHALPAESLNNSETFAVVVASEHGCFGANIEHATALKNGGMAAVSPLLFPATVPSCAASEVAISLKANGPNYTLIGGAEIVYTAFDLTLSLLRREATHVLLGVVDAWHPGLAVFGATPQTHDGACFLYFTAAQGKELAKPFRQQCLSDKTLSPLHAFVTLLSDLNIELRIVQ